MKFLMIVAAVVVFALLVQLVRARRARGADRSKWARINAEALSNQTRAEQRRTNSAGADAAAPTKSVL